MAQHMLCMCEALGLISQFNADTKEKVISKLSSLKERSPFFTNSKQ